MWGNPGGCLAWILVLNLPFRTHTKNKVTVTAPHCKLWSLGGDDMSAYVTNVPLSGALWVVGKAALGQVALGSQFGCDLTTALKNQV